MISAYESIDLVDQCILSGADAYLLKPLRMHELRNIWQYVWRRRHEAVLQQHVSEELMSARRAAERKEPASRRQPSSGAASAALHYRLPRARSRGEAARPSRDHINAAGRARDAYRTARAVADGRKDLSVARPDKSRKGPPPALVGGGRQAGATVGTAASF